MDPATEHLRTLARRVVAAALERVPLRAALLTGSAGRGDADRWSDLDLLLYVDELPSDETIAAIRTAVGGVRPRRRPALEHFLSEEFDLDGVWTEMSFFVAEWADAHLDRLLEQVDEFDSFSQKVLSGVLEGLPLHGHELLERRRARVRDYPESFRRAMIERHWRFFPLWYHAEAIAERDAELWRLDVLLESAFELLAVLAALNRLYFTRFELKRTRALVARMEVAPPDLADRLESLFRLEPGAAADELGRLVDETRALVRGQLPELELPLRFPTDARKQPWSA